MKNKIYREDFENFLRDNSNDFLMVPSRKVWYSIYNDMHPDRKWPSMAVCLLILSAVLYIGVSTNNSLSIAARRATAENMRRNQESNAAAKRNASSDNSITLYSALTHPVATSGYKNISGDSDPINSYYTTKVGVSNSNTMLAATIALPADGTTENELPNNRFPVGLAVSRNNNTPPTTRNASSNIVIEKEHSTLENALTDNKADAPDGSAEKLNEKKVFAAAWDKDRSWQEDFAFRNKPKTNRFRQNAGIAYYITPSFGYRGFFNNNEERSAVLRATGSEKLNDGAALNLEAGASLLYKISPSVRLKAGLQANYTNYVSKVTPLQHPTQITLAVSNRMPEVRASEYSVKSGVARLNKTTFQFALPVGADLKITGNEKIKWYIGATMQPTYVLSGSAYVLSSDAKNYVSESPLLRKWNMNAAVETFVSLRPASGVTLTLGPQFRYQLLSTYKKEYNYTEKLYNIGVKIGLATDF